MIKEIEKIVMENGPRWEIPFFPPRSLFFIKTGGQKKYPGAEPVIFLVFDQRGPNPRWVVKVSRRFSTISVLQKEYQQLLYFYHTLSPGLRKSIPRPLLSREDAGRFLFVETGLPGASLSNSVRSGGGASHQREIGKTTKAVKEWLLKFQRETREGEVEITEEWIEENIGAPLDQYRALYPCSADEARFFDQYLENWKPYLRTRVPLAAHHGNFGAENIRMDGENVFILDWTVSGRKALPFDDILSFISSFVIDPSERGEGGDMESFDEIFFGRGWFSEQVKEVLVQFFFQHKLSPGMISQVFPLFLINRVIPKTDESPFLHSPRWRERLLFYIQNRGRFIDV